MMSCADWKSSFFSVSASLPRPSLSSFCSFSSISGSETAERASYQDRQTRASLELVAGQLREGGGAVAAIHAPARAFRRAAARRTGNAPPRSASGLRPRPARAPAAAPSPRTSPSGTARRRTARGTHRPPAPPRRGSRPGARLRTAARRTRSRRTSTARTVFASSSSPRGSRTVMRALRADGTRSAPPSFIVRASPLRRTVSPGRYRPRSVCMKPRSCSARAD